MSLMIGAVVIVIIVAGAAFFMSGKSGAKNTAQSETQEKKGSEGKETAVVQEKAESADKSQSAEAREKKAKTESVLENDKEKGTGENTEKIISENGFAQDFSRIFCFLLDFNFSDYIYKKAITSYYKSDSLLDTIYGFHLLISDFSNCSISFCTVFLCHSHSFYHSACLIVIIRNCRIKNLFSFFQIFLPC